MIYDFVALFAAEFLIWLLHTTFRKVDLKVIFSLWHSTAASLSCSRRIKELPEGKNLKQVKEEQ